MKSADKKTIYDVTKIYPDHVKVLRFNIAFDVTLGSKLITEKKPNWLFPKILQNQKEDRAARRAKTTIHDLVLCNNFDLFHTYTFDKNKVKTRYDLGYLRAIMQRHLELERKKYGRLKYILVAEEHKDGAIHFHVLTQGYKGKLVQRDGFDPEKPVYNVPGWRYGFSTAAPIKQTDEDRNRVAAYVTKYITKDMVRFPGGKRFLVSKDLVRPEKMINDFHQNPTSEIYCATRRMDDPYVNEHVTITKFTTEKPPLSDENELSSTL